VIIATPIGNAGDITLRALDALKSVNVIACEDTRTSGSLLKRYDVQTPLVPYHEHNAAKMRPKLMERLERGETVALISDAGTPLVSDPGYKLVRTCIERSVAVTALPGASSVLTALTVAGLPTDRFMFCGFLPNRRKARKDVLEEIRGVQTTLVFLESPKRLADSLSDMAEVLGVREAAVTRELTKLFEEVRRGDLATLAEAYGAEPSPKGEVTVVVGPPAAAEPLNADQIDALLRDALINLSVRDASADVAAKTGLAKRDIYQRALALSKEGA